MYRLFLCACLVLRSGPVGLWKQHFSNIEPLSEATNDNSTSSHVLALIGDGGRLLVVNPDSDTVTLVDSTSPGIVAIIQVSDTPVMLGISGDQAYVSNQESNSIPIHELPAKFGDGLIDGYMQPTLRTPNRSPSDESDSLAVFFDSLLPSPRPHILNGAELRDWAIFKSLGRSV
jgi:YVTN family beta-propeller protein